MMSHSRILGNIGLFYHITNSSVHEKNRALVSLHIVIADGGQAVTVSLDTFAAYLRHVWHVVPAGLYQLRAIVRSRCGDIGIAIFKGRCE